MKNWLILLFTIIQAQLSGQTPDSFISNWGLSSHYGFIFAHSKDVQNTEGANPIGFQIEYAKNLIDSNTWNLCNCYPRKGYFLQYMNYDRGLLGSSVAFAGFIEPFFNYKQPLRFSLKGAAGPAWLSNPYHPSSNPSNQSYSLPISAYIALGIGIHYSINKHWQIKTYGHYNHISNGGLKEPNKGINWPTLEVGLTYSPQPLLFPNRSRGKTTQWKSNRHHLDIIGFFSTKTAKAGEKKRYGIGGVQLVFSRQISSINQLRLGTEWFGDAATRELEQRVNRNTNTQRVGMSVGHGFMMGKFLFTQEFGVYLMRPVNYFRPVYQRYTLWYQFNEHVQAGMGLLAHGHVANFLDVKLGYRIK